MEHKKLRGNQCNQPKIKLVYEQKASVSSYTSLNIHMDFKQRNRSDQPKLNSYIDRKWALVLRATPLWCRSCDIPWRAPPSLCTRRSGGTGRRTDRTRTSPGTSATTRPSDSRRRSIPDPRSHTGPWRYRSSEGVDDRRQKKYAWFLLI